MNQADNQTTKNRSKFHHHNGDITPTTLPKPAGALRVLHTSDWHLGKMLYGQSRYEEFGLFLDWLNNQLLEQQIDVLIVAGDIFDTSTPSNRAEHLYHQFLATAFKNQIAHIVIIAGNHDSPSSLQKTKEVLGVLGTTVIGSKSSNPEQDVLVLENHGEPQAIIIAIPYLRDRDVRTSGDAQSIDDKNKQLLQGVAEHYQTLTDIAKQKQQLFSKTYQKQVPIIATGHLFAAGSSVSSSDDGMRDLQVGTLGQIGSQIFDTAIDYVALGHIHAAQMVAKQPRIRYCGSPIAMGFGEIGKQKQVLVIDFQQDLPIEIHSLAVPIFQNLASITGDKAYIDAQIELLKQRDQSYFLEIEYIGSELLPNLRQDILNLLEGSPLIALSIKNKTLHQGALTQPSTTVSLENLNETDVFCERLAKENLSEKEQHALLDAYHWLMTELHEKNGNNA